MSSPSDLRSLRLVRFAHTVVREFFAGSIVAIPDFALRRELRAAIEATEEAVLNSQLRARTVLGVRGREAEALPLEPVLAPPAVAP